MLVYYRNNKLQKTTVIMNKVMSRPLKVTDKRLLKSQKMPLGFL